MNILEGNAIKEILESQDLPGDSVLMVHSAFHGLSQQGFRAEAVIEALLEKITNVTLLMPTMTWKSVTPEKPIFDAMNTPSQTGVLSEIFRAGYATSRSLHPTHSVAGYGQYTNMLLSTHHIGNTPTPLTSPYGIMQDYNSYILLLGVNIEVCTAIHFPEEIIAPQIYLNASEDDVKYTLIDQEEKRLIYSLRRHAPKAKNKWVWS